MKAPYPPTKFIGWTVLSLLKEVLRELPLLCLGAVVGDSLEYWALRGLGVAV